MKLLSINLARTIWFMYLNDLNPRGRSVQRNGILEIASKYAFPKVPTAVEILEAHQKNQPITLAGGTFKNNKGIDVEMGLSIYRDALFADSRSTTQDSEEFITEMLEWLSAELGLVDYKTLAIRKVYVSEMYVSLDKSLNMINPKFSQFAKTLGEKIKTPFKNIHFEVASLAFWIDPDTKHVHVPFRLERQTEAGFAQDRYYSMAPLETEEHLKVLETLEGLMTS